MALVCSNRILAVFLSTILICQATHEVATKVDDVYRYRSDLDLDAANMTKESFEMDSVHTKKDKQSQQRNLRSTTESHGNVLSSTFTKIIIENTCNDIAFLMVLYTTLEGQTWKQMFLQAADQFTADDSIGPVFYVYGYSNSYKFQGESFKCNEENKFCVPMEGVDGTDSIEHGTVHHDLVCIDSPAPSQSPSAIPTPSPTISPEQQWLNAHNSRRRILYQKHNVTAVDLKWSNSIAQSAENYAKTLVALDGCEMRHGEGGDRYGGENLAKHWSKRETPLPPEFILRMWFDREEDAALLEKLHYTQVGWRRTRYLGCGRARKEIWDGICEIHVCRYISKGNCGISEENWLSAMLADSPPCGPECPAEECF